MFTCSVCFKAFTLNKNLYQHMRNKHRIEPTIPGAKMVCPLFCADKFRTRKELRSHLELFHDYVVEKEELNFSDYEAFETWKARLESSSGFSYICRISEKVLSRGEAKAHFYCHRSGVFRSGSTGQRRARKEGSKKIGSTCPSSMEVTRSVTDGKVHVLFWKTHIGHGTDNIKPAVRKPYHPKIADTITYDVHAILPAAGIGERMGLDVPKQFVKLHGRPVICYTVDAFLRLPFIKKVIVVAAPENLDLMAQTLMSCDLKDEKIMVAEGSKTRHESIHSGLKAIQTCSDIQPEVVVIHDGVRPFLSEEIVRNVVTAAKEHGAAGVICPLVSTVLCINENNFLDCSLDRNKFKASEMPQAFQFDVITKAYAECSADDFEYGTECLHLVQKYCNINAKLLPGSTNLWKITHRKDIYSAEACVKESQAVAIITSETSDLVGALRTSVCKKFKYVRVAEKLNDKTVENFQNIIKLWKQKSIYDIIDEFAGFYTNLKVQSSTVVHILFDSLQENLDFFEMQHFARSAAAALKSSHILFYFISLQTLDSSNSLEEISELTTTLLFDNNPSLSGNIFVL